MNLLSDIITYVRRMIKSPSDSVITDSLIIDYINRFWLMDIDARVQLFDMKTTYQFQTTPGVCHYNMPLYDTQNQTGSPNIASFPVYQGFLEPALVNGIQVPFYTQRQAFYNIWPTYTQQVIPGALGDGTATYDFNLPFFPAIPGYVDISGIIAIGANEDPPVDTTINTKIPSTSIYPGVYITTTDSTGANVVISDSGQFLEGNVRYGLLMRQGNAPKGYVALDGGYSTTSNTVNYETGEVNVTFTDAVGNPLPILANTPINIQCYFIEPGIPRAILYQNNNMTLMPPPNTQYMVQLDAYLTPSAFLSSTGAIPFGYMAEYIARGAARKILSDTGDTEQFMFYEPLFKEQETLVWKRSQRQFTSTRTGTIFSESGFQTGGGNIGQGTA